VLSGEGHEGKIYELAGDTAYTLAELAAEISKQSGKNIPYKNLPVDDYAAALTGFGLPQGIAKAIAGWDAGAAKGTLFDAGRQLSKLIGRPTTSLSKTVADALGRIPKNP
jgi:NAD(P)H dehydrogenase (quinone)